MARRGKVAVSITADNSSLKRGVKDSEHQLGRLQRVGVSSSRGLSAGFKAAGGVIAGAAVADQIRQTIVAAQEAEVSQRKLATQLKASGISYRAHATEIDRVIQKTSQLAGLDDEDLQDAFTNIVRVTGNVNKSLRLTGLAADFARAKHMDVAKAGEIVGKVAGGNVGILSRYGITIRKGASATEALGKLQEKFKGQAEAYGKTSAGASDRFRVAVENLRESVGAKLLPVLTRLTNRAADFVNQMQDGTGAGGRFASKLKDIADRIRPIAKFFADHPKLIAIAVGAWVTYRVAASAALAVTRLRLLGMFGGLGPKAAAGGAIAGRSFGGAAATSAGTTFGRRAPGRFAGLAGSFRGAGSVIGIAMGGIAAAEFIKQLSSAANDFYKDLASQGGVKGVIGKIGQVGSSLAHRAPIFGGQSADDILRPITGATKNANKPKPKTVKPSAGALAAPDNRPRAHISSGRHDPGSASETARRYAADHERPRRTVITRNNHMVLNRRGHIGRHGFTPGRLDRHIQKSHGALEPFAPTAHASAARAQPDPGDIIGAIEGRADLIDSKHVPYLWGGGHGGRFTGRVMPMDCSGAVSAALGIDPRVSGQFTTWGSPGDGGSRGVTVYANATHVLMKINGRFWGTSRSNPGGGPGWIEGGVPAGYLSGFTARHMAGVGGASSALTGGTAAPAARRPTTLTATLGGTVSRVTGRALGAKGQRTTGNGFIQALRPAQPSIQAKNMRLFQIGSRINYITAAIQGGRVRDPATLQRLAGELEDLGTERDDLLKPADALTGTAAIPGADAHLGRLGKDAALAGLTPGNEDDIAVARQTVDAWQAILDYEQNHGISDADITDAATSLKGARDALDGLTTAVTENTQQLLDIEKQRREETQRALNVSQSQYGVLAKAIADVANGQIGGRLGLGFKTPSFAGGVARP